MSIDCDVILQWNANPRELRAVGGALWRWCNGGAGGAGPYQSLDNQAIADLIDGKLPASGRTSRQAERRGVRLRVRDEVSRDRREAIAHLRRELPAAAVEDVVVDGVSWNCAGDGSNPSLDLDAGLQPVPSP